MHETAQKWDFLRVEEFFFRQCFHCRLFAMFYATKLFFKEAVSQGKLENGKFTP